MPYTPDATDVTNPLDVGIQASTAAAEFRTIKLYMRDVLLAAINLRAPLASPALTGTPTAPTAAVDTNTTQLATTAYVIGQGYLKSSTAASTYAPLASPSLTGTPTAPTPAANNNSTRIATTAYVDAADALKANLASPTFTGTPAAPTAAVDTNTTQIATTAYVIGQGYLKSATAASTYAPLTGGGASGTWGINVTGSSASCTGNAATASTASAVSAGGTVGGIEIGFRRAVSGSVTTGSVAATDSGKGIYATGGVTIPNATFAQGDILTIYNTTAAGVTLTFSITNAYFNGTNNGGGGTKSLAARGVATIIFGSSTECIMSGNLS